jgi:hypothetical protein
MASRRSCKSLFAYTFLEENVDRVNVVTFVLEVVITGLDEAGAASAGRS